VLCRPFGRPRVTAGTPLRHWEDTVSPPDRHWRDTVSRHCGDTVGRHRSRAVRTSRDTAGVPAASCRPRTARACQGALETNLARKGLYATGPIQLALPLAGEDLLGVLWSSGSLKVDPDLDLLIWLTEGWRTRGSPDGTLEFTLYEVSRALYQRAPSGNDTRRLKASLRRLRTTAVDLVGYDAINKRSDVRIASVETILERLTSRLDDIDIGTGAEAGALRGNTMAVTFPDWIVQSLKAGHVTYYRMAILRRLAGLAKRLWVYLEAERYKRVGEGSEATWMKLGQRAYTTLGMHYAHERQGRAALKTAAKRIMAVDAETYLSIEVEPAPLGGWRLLAIRRNAEGRRVRREILASLA
jgi:hypothetical protein